MKFKLVPISFIEQPGRILEATPYVDPTSIVDQAITRTERAINVALARLARLNQAREKLTQHPLGVTRYQLEALKRK